MAFFEHPLSWPPEFRRTAAAERKPDRFGRRADNGFTRPLTVLQAFDRVVAEMKAFTVCGHDWPIHPDAVVVSTNIEIRRSDNRPRLDRKSPEDVGVAVYFTLDDDDYCLPCDKWDSVAGNLAAIAAHLAAIRGIERWGVGDIRASFKGYQALPDPNRVIWRDVFGVAPDDSPTLDELDQRYKKLRSQRHPDKGGSAHEFDRIVKAYKLALEEIRDAG